ncbi:MAG: hypothetical protein HW414_799, partial [Dehalococcoidia bacterium]|nr:hypothetical protein [Dehalococcoidia bacterium]
MKPHVITLTTDFGLDDACVAVIKAVILSINPQANIIDLCHTIRPFNVRQAAFLLGISHSYFPPGAIHLAVVDPGVGSQRRAILIATQSAFLLGPDNGVFSYITGHASRSRSRTGSSATLSPGCQAFVLKNPRYWRTTVSATFHGRDVFAP